MAKKTAQYYNPSTPENLLLQPGVDGLGNATNGVLSPRELYDSLKKVLENTDPELVLDELEAVLEKSSNPDIKAQIQSVIDAEKFEGHGKPKTQNLDTGEFHKDGPARARELMEDLKPMIKAEEQQPQQQQQQSPQPQQVVAKVRKNDKPAKDDSRGNPFKVLLGQIGKLKDHGASDSEVKKFLRKDGIFGDDLIDKGLKIYKDLQKKKSKTPKKAFNLNEYRIALAASEKEPETIYDVPPDFIKRSTNELMARLGWLKSLESMTKDSPIGEGREAFSKEGASEEITKIKKALRSRGFDESEI